MFAPVQWHNDLIAIVSIQSYTPFKYNDRDLQLFSTLINQCGGALSRTMFEEELRKHRNHLEELVMERAGQLKIANTQLQQEINERKKIEEALHISEIQYRTTIHSLADPVHVVDRELKFVLFNDAFKKWNQKLGLESTVIGETIFEIFPFLSKIVQDQYEQVFKIGTILNTEEKR